MAFHRMVTMMDPFSMETARVALIRIAREVAGDPSDRAAFLRRFRVAYQHLAASVDSATARMNATMAGPHEGGFYPMPAEMMPKDPEKLRAGAQELLDTSDSQLSDLD